MSFIDKFKKEEVVLDIPKKEKQNEFNLKFKYIDCTKLKEDGIDWITLELSDVNMQLMNNDLVNALGDLEVAKCEIKGSSLFVKFVKDLTSKQITEAFKIYQNPTMSESEAVKETVIFEQEVPEALKQGYKK